MTQVWITGGGSGIGKALALSYAQDDWDVIISGRDQQKLDEVCRQSSRIQAVLCDITQPASVASCIESFGLLDLAILNAGDYSPGPTSEAPMADFRKSMEINYFGTLNCIQALLPRMKTSGGKLAVVASLAGYIGLPNASGYGPGKAALISLCESLRAELEGSSVIIQVINPGFVKSNLTAKNNFAMPFLIEPEAAALEIREGLETDKFEIAFPAPFVRRMKFLRLLPYWAYFILMRKIARS